MLLKANADLLPCHAPNESKIYMSFVLVMEDPMGSVRETMPASTHAKVWEMELILVFRTEIQSHQVAPQHRSSSLCLLRDVFSNRYTKFP